MVNSDNAKGNQGYPVCAALINGGFVIAFVRKSDLAIKFYDKDGNALMNEFRINTVIETTGVKVASLGTGGVIVTYSSMNVAYYQLYSSGGTIVFPETKVSNAGNYYYKQGTPYASSFSGSNFILTWGIFLY
jgi:hypothetical protein